MRGVVDGLQTWVVPEMSERFGTTRVPIAQVGQTPRSKTTNGKCVSMQNCTKFAMELTRHAQCSIS